MQVLVADTSGLVSLGIVAEQDPDPLDLCLATYDVRVPETVVDELRETASDDDKHGEAADAVLERTAALTIQSVALDADFPLDDGENAAVALANDVEATLCLCDEFNSLGLVHASLANTRLVTTPILLSVLVRTGQTTSADALSLLQQISLARSWETNSYVQRAESLLENLTGTE